MELNEFLRLNFKPRGAKAKAKFAQLLAEDKTLERGPISLGAHEGAFMYVAKKPRLNTDKMAVCSLGDAFSLDAEVIGKRKYVPATEYMPEVRLGVSFADMLNYWMEKKHLTGPQVYNACDLSRANFSKQFTPNHNPSQKTVMSLCIGLKLNLQESEALLKKAGYFFRDTSYVDMVYMHYISEEKYNIGDIEDAIYRWEQMQLEEAEA